MDNNGYTPRARIGLIIPSSNRMVEPHATRYLPFDVACHVTRLQMTGPHFMALEKLLPKVTQAAEYLKDAKCAPIIFHCTANSMSDGMKGENLIKESIEKVTNMPAATTASATMAAFEFFGAKNVVLLSPYPRKSHQHELEFLAQVGCKIVGEKNLNLNGSDAYCSMPASAWLDAVLKMKNDDADIYFISCANIQALDQLEQIEQALGAPVVTSNQLVLWRALRMAGVNDTIPGFGKLAA